MSWSSYWVYGFALLFCHFALMCHALLFIFSYCIIFPPVFSLPTPASASLSLAFPFFLCLFQPITPFPVFAVYFPHLRCSTLLHLHLFTLLVVCVHSLCAPSSLCQFVLCHSPVLFPVSSSVSPFCIWVFLHFLFSWISFFLDYFSFS